MSAAVLLRAPARSTRIVACLLMAAAAACSTAPAPTRAVVEGRVPDAAIAVDDTLYVRYPPAAGAAGTGRALVLAADWSQAVAGAPASSYRAARLEVQEEGVDLEALRSRGRAVTLLPAGAWDSLLHDSLWSFAPPQADQAALAVVQGNDVVFARAGDRLQFHRLERKPADLRVVRRVSDEELSQQVSTALRERHGADGLVLFDTGGSAVGRALVLVDIARSQTVLVIPASAQVAATPPADPQQALSVTEALILRSHVVTPLTQPVTAAARLSWLTLQTTLGLVPKTRPAPITAPPAAGAAAPMDLVSFERELDERFGARAIAAPRLDLLIDGDVFFPRLVQSIQDARESVLIRLYIFDTDPYALQIADLLKERSREIEVRVLLDELGTIAAASAIGRLPYAGGYPYPDTPGSIVDYLQQGSAVHVRTVSNPWLTSDHTKAIVIDGERAFVGGMNIGMEYRYEWHDLMVELQGAAAAKLARDFELAWSNTAAGGDLARLARALERGPDPEPSPAAGPRVRLLTTRTGNPEILTAQLMAIRRARQLIYVEQPYVSDDEIIAALVDARRRGVDVRVVLPTAGDSGFMNAANLVATNVFVRNGVRVYAYPGMTHAKAALFDGWACLGSANYDKLSLRINRELNIATSDPVFVAALRQNLFERDFQRAREVTEPQPLGWSTYISSYIANQL